jgi:D-sedoheptulose 7-phosphate isomerase
MSVARTIDEHLRVIEELRGLSVEIERVAAELTRRLREGGKLLFLGNGGSAADSQHLAAELVGRFRAERAALPAIALTTDTSILTSVGNDYGFDTVFARQIEALCGAADAVVAISTSGASPNVLEGLKAAGKIGAYRVGLTGREGEKMAGACDACLAVPSTDTARIQEAHILIGHILCELIDRAMTGKQG